MMGGKQAHRAIHWSGVHSLKAQVQGNTPPPPLLLLPPPTPPPFPLLLILYYFWLLFNHGIFPD